MINNLFKKIKRKKKGFTVVESLFAIFILLLSITGPMVFTQSGLRASFVARDQVTAFFLAQDAIEYIKNVRDNNVLNILDGNPGDWLDSLNDCLNINGCTIDTSKIVSSAFSSCASDNGIGCIKDDDINVYTPLQKNIDPTTGLELFGFGFSGTPENSIFAREIKIKEIGNNEAEITVTVRWETAKTIGVREIVVKEFIYNWAASI